MKVPAKVWGECRGWLRAAVALAVVGVCWAGESAVGDLDAPPHNYRLRKPQDAFTRMQGDLASGKIPLDRSSEKGFLLSLLRALGIPASSQLLVFSTTSLQLSLISPQNPRALYFNEDTYVGYVPGGRIEIVSVDSDLGGIFYIFDIPRGDRPLFFERSDRCMNCHAREDAGQVPGLVVKSVIPGPGGGSLTAYRIGQTGHGIPLDQRFGGWHVTGAGDFTNHFGNCTGTLADGKLTRIPNQPGARYEVARYPTGNSDLLAHLLHEHQAGFVNRVLLATYLARQLDFENPERLTRAQEAELDLQARNVVRYLLFAEEAALPPGGVTGDSGFKADFLRTRRVVKDVGSLKDLDLQTRLMRHRCSYMIYSAVFQGLPAAMKQRVYRQLADALNPASKSPDYAHLPATERQNIRTILQATLTDLPSGW